jgi:hypothetical protein
MLLYGGHPSVAARNIFSHSIDPMDSLAAEVEKDGLVPDKMNSRMKRFRNNKAN